MEIKTTVGISNRHMHITKETFEYLFGLQELEHKKDLNQIGQYATNHVVTIKSNDRFIENVRILGPFRSYNQVEISKTDSYTLKLNPPVRASGDLKGAAPITVIGPNGSIELPEAAIIANRHLHVNTNEVEKYKLKNNQVITIHIDGEKKGTIEAVTKVSDDGYFELHLDTDDANAFLLNNGDEVRVTYES